ncbi:hypothetical protein [Solibaculum intestinale]|uniref:hypothetical protein n=1 Tax=Solibaculum intestinale TaxID=3133165 RepID=UPI0032C15E68
MPFFPATMFCFTNSSQKLHNRFVNTKLYKKHLERFKDGALNRTVSRNMGKAPYKRTAAIFADGGCLLEER